MKLQHRRAVVDTIAHHGANDAQLIDHATDVGKQAADRDAAFAAAFEGKRRLHQTADMAVGKLKRFLEGKRLAVIGVEARFGVERVDM